MGHNSNVRKAATLGMPFGTASNRLKKNILFKYVCRAGDNFCHKCGAEIETVDELSIEHIQPWEGRDPELFWDLDNIAFSHLKCNRPHSTPQPTVNTIEGKIRCYVCGVYKDTGEYYRNNTAPSGVQHHCKECHKSWRRRRNNATASNMDN